MEKNIWLSREGAMSGPFGETEIEALRTSGELSRYGWIWRLDTAQWSPVHPRPSSAPVQASVQASAMQAATASSTPGSSTVLPAGKPAFLSPRSGATSSASASTAPIRPLAVICHDQRNVVSGMIQSLREGGCLVSSEQGLDSLPLFRKGAQISVNLLDEALDRAENVLATVASVRRESDPDRWCYDLNWSQRPEIIAANLRGSS